MPVTTLDAQSAGLPYAQAKLFSYICHAYPKAKALHDGQRFVAVTREQLMLKCELTPEQVRHALERLKQYGLLTVEQHKWGGKTLSYMRPLREDLLGWVKPLAGSKRGKSTALKSDFPHPEGGDISPSYPRDISPTHTYGDISPTLYNRKNIEETNRKARHVAVQTFSENVVQLFEKKSEMESLSGSPKKSMADVTKELLAKRLAKQTETLSTESLLAVQSVAKLASVWRQSHVACEMYCTTLSGKQQMALKRILQNAPAGQAGFIVDHAIRNWLSFCVFAKEAEGAFGLSKYPDPMILGRYVKSAVLFWAEHNPSTANNPTQPQQKPTDSFQASKPTPISASSSKGTQEALKSAWGFDVPEGYTVKIVDDEAWISKGGHRIMPPAMQYGQHLLLKGSAFAENWWLTTHTGAFPDPTPYYFGTLADQLTSLTLKKADAV